jgi:superfamily I DNA/RNA helicase
VATFLEELTLTATDDRTAEDADRRDAVTLMTMHAAKGLEFPRVCIAGMEEGLLPHLRSVQEDAIEEERRLAYVAITRAMTELVVTYATQRARFGRRQSTMPSRFLYELLDRPPPETWRPAGEPRPPEASPRQRRGGRSRTKRGRRRR